jgi:PsbN protein
MVLPYFKFKISFIDPFIMNFYMESPAFFFAFFLWFLLLSVTGYSVYVSFGPPSKKLRDPFEEHED